MLFCVAEVISVLIPVVICKLLLSGSDTLTSYLYPDINPETQIRTFFLCVCVCSKVTPHLGQESPDMCAALNGS